MGQCFSNDWQFAGASFKFNSNLLDQVAKFRLSFDEFCFQFFQHKLKQYNFCAREGGKKIHYSPLLSTDLESFHIAKLKSRFKIENMGFNL